MERSTGTAVVDDMEMTSETIEKLITAGAEKGKKIWTLKRVKSIPTIIEKIVIELSKLDAIKYIKITEDSIQASSELSGNKGKIPNTRSFHLTATGIYLVFDFEYKMMQFYEINSTIKGYGEKMVAASLKDIPDDWEVAIVFDWSGGFWEKMQQRYSRVKWMII